MGHAYDEYGRELGCSVDGAARTKEFDDLGRVSKVTNILGTFGCAYLGNSGRVDYVTHGGGMKVDYDYYPVQPAQGPGNIGNSDLRLAQIKNTTVGASVTYSQFDYGYQAAGNIRTWEQTQEGVLEAYSFGYGRADQLTWATDRDSMGTVLKEYGYRYDLAGNREIERINTRDTGVPGGFRTTLSQGAFNKVLLGIAWVRTNGLELERLRRTWCWGWESFRERMLALLGGEHVQTRSPMSPNEDARYTAGGRRVWRGARQELCTREERL